MTTNKKKIRGLSRKFRLLNERIIENTREFPDSEDRYWHIPIPCRSDLLVSPKVKHRYKQQLVHLLIERAEILNTMKPKDQFCRVVCCFTTSDLWNSQIILFFSEDYYEQFFNRDSDYQKWIPIKSTHSILNKWNLKLDITQVSGYHQVIKDEDETFESALWFYECSV